MCFVFFHAMSSITGAFSLLPEKSDIPCAILGSQLLLNSTLFRVRSGERLHIPITLFHPTPCHFHLSHVTKSFTLDHHHDWNQYHSSCLTRYIYNDIIFVIPCFLINSYSLQIILTVPVATCHFVLCNQRNYFHYSTHFQTKSTNDKPSTYPPSHWSIHPINQAFLPTQNNLQLRKFIDRNQTIIADPPAPANWHQRNLILFSINYIVPTQLLY